MEPQNDGIGPKELIYHQQRPRVMLIGLFSLKIDTNLRKQTLQKLIFLDPNSAFHELFFLYCLTFPYADGGN